MPCSCARRAAASAAICAANGVDLREPLKPTWPADAHEITAPLGSVMETIVLLNVLLMCAWPWETFFFSLRRGLRAEPVAALFCGGICRELLLAGLPAARRPVESAKASERPPDHAGPSGVHGGAAPVRLLLARLLLAGDGALGALAGA